MSDFPPPPPPGYQQYGYGYAQTGAQPTLSGFWRRLVAAVIDSLILSVPNTGLDFIVNGSDAVFRAGYGYTGDIVVSVLSTVVGVLYFALLEGGERGQTVGKMALGIRVVDADRGTPIGVGRGVGRYFARWLSALPCGLGYLWMLWDPRKQTWHDKLVRSVVVRTR